MKFVVVALAGTAVVSSMMESKIAGLNIPRDMRSMMAQMAADPPRRLTAEEKAVADAEYSSMVELESTEGGGLRKLQDSNTYWYVEKKCGEQLQNFCTDTGICGRGEGVVLDTCVSVTGSSVDPWQFPVVYQSAIWSIKDPDIDGEEDEIKYKISVKFWDVANCAGGHDGSWPTNNQVGVADYLFNECDTGLWRKRVNGKPWEEFQLSEIQNKDTSCTAPRFFSGYDVLENCLKGPYAGRFATCTDSSYVQYYNVDDPTCQEAKVVLESHVTDVCTPEDNIASIPGEFIQPLGLEFTGNELMYYCVDLYSQEDEALTNVETAVAAVSAFFFFLLCFNVYYFCLRPEQDDDETEAQYYVEKAMFEKTAGDNPLGLIKKKGGGDGEETELGSDGFNPMRAPRKVRTPPCLTTMLSSKGGPAPPPPPPPPPPPGIASSGVRSSVRPQDVPGIRFEIE